MPSSTGLQNNNDTPDWPTEEIPDADTLYLRVHQRSAPGGDLLPGAFRDHEGGMSTNWQKYCPTAAEARNKARNPALNGVVSLLVQAVRKVPLSVKHTPLITDRSHTDVIGEKDAEARAKLMEIFRWEIRFD